MMGGGEPGVFLVLVLAVAQAVSCPGRWIPRGDACLWMMNSVKGEPLTWDEGERRCRENGATIAVLEREAIQKVPRLSYVKEWVWAGTPEQTGRRGEVCPGYSFKTGTWNLSAPCDRLGTAVCQLDSRFIPTTPAPKPTCQDGWMPYKGRCFIIRSSVFDTVAYDEAMQYCDKRDADMVDLQHDPAREDLQRDAVWGSIWSYDTSFPALVNGQRTCLRFVEGSDFAQDTCHRRNSYICVKRTHDPWTPCKQGWYAIEGTCFRVYNTVPYDMRSYASATTECDKQGAELARVHDGMGRAIFDTASDFTFPSIWSFDPALPSNDTVPRCRYVYEGGASYEAVCNSNLGYVCSRPFSLTTVAPTTAAVTFDDCCLRESQDTDDCCIEEYQDTSDCCFAEEEAPTTTVAPTTDIPTTRITAANNLSSLCVEEEKGGVVVEFENAGFLGKWKFYEDAPGYTGSGFIEYSRSNPFTRVLPPAEDIFSVTVKLFTPGVWRILIRGATPHRTRHNDVFLRFPDTGAFLPRRGDESDVETADSTVWIKSFNSGDPGVNVWNWQTTAGAGVRREIEFEAPVPGEYRVMFSARSSLFKMDRMVLYRPSDTSFEEVTALSRQQGPQCKHEDRFSARDGTQSSGRSSTSSNTFAAIGGASVALIAGLGLFVWLRRNKTRPTISQA